MPIFDQGYQNWTGELTGHGSRWLAIAKHGVRIGRKSILLRLLLLLAWLPAVVLAVALCIWGLVEQKSTMIQPWLPILSDVLGPEIVANPKNYRVEFWTTCYENFLVAELRLSMIVILFVGPSLISQDLRFNALPLYFSRPLRRIDYFLGKLGVIGMFLSMVLVLPSLIAYGFGMLFSLDISILVDTLPLLLAVVTYGLIMTLSAGLFILALSSLSRNSRYVGLFWVGVWFLTAIVAVILQGSHQYQRAQARFDKMEQAQKDELSRKQGSTPEEAQRQREAQTKFIDEFAREELENSKSDWRPMVSYTGNLARVGQAMLGIDSCWRKRSQDVPAEERDRYLVSHLGPQYPWSWAVALLFVLFGICVWILNFRVKSLDRLK